MHVLKVGCRWADCPKAYGPKEAHPARQERRQEPQRQPIDLVDNDGLSLSGLDVLPK
jgi:transposase